jgi:hypothetical protein
MIWYVIENYFNLGIEDYEVIEKGWGSGYIAVPPTHPLHIGNTIIPSEILKKQITLVQSLDVHGGITYNNYGDGKYAPKDWWVIGFHTNYNNDTIKNWPKEAVEAETKRLFCQLLDIELGEL